MICDFGDVVVVPFPFVDRPIAKHRPALVLTSRDFNADNEQTVLSMITTGAGSSWPSDIMLRDHEAAGLLHPSIVRWKIFTLPNGGLLRHLGAIGDADRTTVRRAARAFLAP